MDLKLEVKRLDSRDTKTCGCSGIPDCPGVSLIFDGLLLDLTMAFCA